MHGVVKQFVVLHLDISAATYVLVSIIGGKGPMSSKVSSWLMIALLIPRFEYLLLLRGGCEH